MEIIIYKIQIRRKIYIISIFLHGFRFYTCIYILLFLVSSRVTLKILFIHLFIIVYYNICFFRELFFNNKVTYLLAIINWIYISWNSLRFVEKNGFIYLIDCYRILNVHIAQFSCTKFKENFKCSPFWQ